MISRLTNIAGTALGKGWRAADRAQSHEPATFSRPQIIGPNVGKRPFNASHYGVMIPNLPEPFRYFSLMALIGSSGVRFIDTDHMLKNTPTDHASQVSGTAVEDTAQFASYSVKRDCDIREDGSLIRFGNDVTLSGRYPTVRLQVTRAAFELDIQLNIQDNVTWFSDLPIYQHLGLMADYQGYIDYDGKRTSIGGHCTYEYARMSTPYGAIKKPLPMALRAPLDFFTYQIVHIDDDTQLMLARVGGLGTAWVEKAWVRRRGEASFTLANNTQFDVIEFETTPRIGPDGFQMRLPKTFRWTVKDGGKTFAIINGTVDTPMTYGLCRGYVGGYHYHGKFNGKPVDGRAYIEYVDTSATAQTGFRQD
jgi:hypothetical protein